MFKKVRKNKSPLVDFDSGEEVEEIKMKPKKKVHIEYQMEDEAVPEVVPAIQKKEMVRSNHVIDLESIHTIKNHNQSSYLEQNESVEEYQIYDGEEAEEYLQPAGNEEEEFIAYDTRNTEHKRVAMVGEKEEKKRGERHELLSSEDDEEFSKYEQAVIRQSSHYNHKQFAFNSSKQQQSKFLQRIKSLSFESVLQDIQNNVQVDHDSRVFIERELEQLKSATDSSHMLVRNFEKDLQQARVVLSQKRLEFEFLKNFQDMMAEKYPILAKAFDEFNIVAAEYQDCVMTKVHKLECLSLDDVDAKYEELFQDETLFLLQDFKDALGSILGDVDDAYLDLPRLPFLCLQSPIFKYKFLLHFLKCYIDADHNSHFQECDLFLGQAPDLILELQPLLKALVRLNPFQPSIISYLLASLVERAFASVEDPQLKARALVLIKSLLEHTVKQMSHNLRVFSIKKMENILLFKGILPDKNLRQLLNTTKDHLNEELNNDKYTNFRASFQRKITILD